MWIIPSVCSRAQLAPLSEACRATGMTQPVSTLFDIRARADGLDMPANWTLVPAMGRLDAAKCLRIASASSPRAPCYGILPADHRPVSPGWDAALERAAGRWNIAYCNDLVSAGSHPVGGADRVTGAVCIGGGLARVMGTLLPPGMSLEDARIAWAVFGRALGALRFLPGVVVEWERARATEAVPPFAARGADYRARLFRWLNDDLRPLARRVREARAAEAVAEAHEDRAV